MNESILDSPAHRNFRANWDAMVALMVAHLNEGMHITDALQYVRKAYKDEIFKADYGDYRYLFGFLFDYAVETYPEAFEGWVEIYDFPESNGDLAILRLMLMEGCTIE